MVRVGSIGAEYFRLMSVHLLLSRIERVPLRQTIGPGSELGIWRNNTELLLVSKNLIAQVVPAHVEFAFHLGDPFRSGVVRRVRTSWHIVEEKGLLWRGGIQIRQILDCLVGHIGDQVVAGLPDPREDGGMISKEIGRPLIGFTAHEPVEVIETHPARPLVEGSSQAVEIGRRVMVLAEPGRGIAVLLKDLADGAFVLCNDAVVARVTGGLLGDHTKTRRVMVAAG